MTAMNSCVVDKQIKIDLYGVEGSYTFVLDNSTVPVDTKAEMYQIFAQYAIASETQSCTFKVCEGANSRYIHLNPNQGMMEKNTHKEIRKVLASESEGAWVEIKNGVNRFFVSNPNMFSWGIKEDQNEFFNKTQLTPEAFLAQPEGERERADTEFDELSDGETGNYMSMPASSSDDEADVMLPTFMNPKSAKRGSPTNYVPIPTKEAVGVGFTPKHPKSPPDAGSNYVPINLAPIVASPPAESLIPVFLRGVDFQTLLQGGSLNLQMTTSAEEGSEESKHILTKVEAADQLTTSIPKKVAKNHPVVAQPKSSAYMPMPQKKVSIPVAKGSTYTPFPKSAVKVPKTPPKYHNDGNHYIPLEGQQGPVAEPSTYISLTEYAAEVNRNAQAPKGIGTYVNMAEINSKIPPKFSPKVSTDTYLPFPKKAESSEDEDF